MNKKLLIISILVTAFVSMDFSTALSKPFDTFKAEKNVTPFSRNIRTQQELPDDTKDISLKKIPNEFFEDSLVQKDSRSIPFEAINPNINGSAATTTAWADLDNDGDFDLVCGSSQYALFSIYENMNNNIFIRKENPLTPNTPFAVKAFNILDINNDNLLDLVLVSLNNDPVKLYINNGNLSFSNINIVGEPFTSNTRFTNGDIDGDGDLDIVIAGEVGTGSSQETGGIILRNDGIIDGQLIIHVLRPLVYEKNGSVSHVFVKRFVPESAPKLVDLNNNGMLDIFYTIPGRKPCLYRNDGNGIFTDVSPDNFLSRSHSFVFDINNNGQQDVILYTFGESNTRIFGNNGNFTFTDIGDGGAITKIPGSSAWGDFNNDGYIDIVSGPSPNVYYGDQNCGFTLAGNINGVEATGFNAGDYNGDHSLDVVSRSQSANKMRILKNITTLPNQAPEPPQNVQTILNPNGTIIELIWDQGTDDHTPANGLTYNLFVGSAPNEVDIISPMADLNTGYRRISRPGSQGQSLSFVLEDLQPGEYFWGVQSIDTAFIGSPFQTGTFVIEDPSQYVVEGKVSSDNVGLAGIAIKDVDNPSITYAISQSNGTYSFLADKDTSFKTQAVDPQGLFLDFTTVTGEVFYQYEEINQNYYNQDFNSQTSVYTISGKVTLNGEGLADVNIKEGAYVLFTTTSDGNYSITKPQSWSGTLYPEKEEYVFAPLSRPYYNLQEHHINQDYMASEVIGETCTVSGKAFFAPPAKNDNTFRPFIGAELVNVDPDSYEIIEHLGVFTDEQGHFEFYKPRGWSGNIALYRPANGEILVSFFALIGEEGPFKIENLQQDTLVYNWTLPQMGGPLPVGDVWWIGYPTMVPYIKGKVLDSNGTPVEGARVYNTTAPMYESYTNNQGEYTIIYPFFGLLDITHTVSLSRVAFEPETIYYSILDRDFLDQDFIMQSKKKGSSQNEKK
ncbi:MAG: FG-GAP-like repeat-containing protein [Candidatus Omnitrophica bacterium]|nr:FG-GAP-like repeat-containing protein [Candidatus Omnitrophota bacterium]